MRGVGVVVVTPGKSVDSSLVESLVRGEARWIVAHDSRSLMDNNVFSRPNSQLGTVTQSEGECFKNHNALSSLGARASTL